MASMTPQVFFLKQGDTNPVITATLIDQNQQVANLTGASVKFRMTNSFYGNVVNATATIVNATLGQVSYSWQTDDTNSTGTFSCQWYVVYSGGAQESFPQGFYNTVQIDPSLTSGFLGGQPSTPLFNTIWNSASDPGNSQGNNGDYWYNTVSGIFRGPKAAGVWPSGFQLNPAVSPINTFGVATGNVGMGGFSFNNLGATVITPAPTTVTPLTVGTPASSTADVMVFEQNSTPVFKVNSAGNAAVLNGLQLDITAASATNPIKGNAASTYTVTPTNLTVASGTLTGTYIKIGRMVTAWISFTWNGSSGTSGWSFSLPFTPATTNYNGVVSGSATAVKSGAFYGGNAVLSTAGGVTPVFPPTTAGNAWTAPQTTTPTPFAWATGNTLSITVTYEATT